jgi:hypothetical protein
MLVKNLNNSTTKKKFKKEEVLIKLVNNFLCANQLMIFKNNLKTLNLIGA